MAKQVINLGTSPTGVGGDTSRSANVKVNSNIDEVYAALGANEQGEIPAAIPINKGGTGATTASVARDELGAASTGANEFSARQIVRTGNPTLAYPPNANLGVKHIASLISGLQLICGNTAQARIWFGNHNSEIVSSITFQSVDATTGHLVIAGDVRLPSIYGATTAAAANVNIASNGALTRSTSSLQYKTNVEVLSDEHADNVIFNAKPIWYRSSCEADNCEWSWYGLGAEDVAEIDPRLVHWRTTETQQVERKESFEEDGETKTEVFQDAIEVPLSEPVAEGVQYDRFVPHLINVIQRLTKRIEVLEST